MNAQMLKEILPDILSDLPQVHLVYLFGSRVEGNIGPLSDYDLAVLVERTADEDQILARLTHKLARALETARVDVVPLSRAPIELAYAVIARGERLYQRDMATRVEYEAKVMSLYGDYLPVLRAQRDDILRGDEHGKRVQRYRAALGRTERTLDQIKAPAGKKARRV